MKKKTNPKIDIAFVLILRDIQNRLKKYLVRNQKHNMIIIRPRDDVTATVTSRYYTFYYNLLQYIIGTL